MVAVEAEGALDSPARDDEGELRAMVGHGQGLNFGVGIEELFPPPAWRRRPGLSRFALRVPSHTCSVLQT